MNIRFSRYQPDPNPNIFERLLALFLQLLQHTGGDVAEALQWMNELDQEHGLTTNDFSMADFLERLKELGYIVEQPMTGQWAVTPKAGQVIRKRALEEIFGKLKHDRAGDHLTYYSGQGDEKLPDSRPYQFGDVLDQIDLTASLRSAQINHGIDDFRLTEQDIQIFEQELKTTMATVLLIDISHSMVLYGEDRITPAKTVAMALAELIKQRYPKDFLAVVAFGDDAWPIEIQDLPYLQVGPYHTNTHAGLTLALQILTRRKASNRQIFMITDGKPTCIKEGSRYYRNSFGPDRKILNKTLALAAQCKKLGIPITTFMLARDAALQRFVRTFTRANEGRAFYASPHEVGVFLLEDFVRNRKKYLQ